MAEEGRASNGRETAAGPHWNAEVVRGSMDQASVGTHRRPAQTRAAAPILAGRSLEQ